MATVIVVLVFVAGYIAIAFEHRFRLDKAATALITGVLCWLVYFVQSASPDASADALLHHVGSIASILFFLLGAMTIVELIDSHGGFDILTKNIAPKKLSTLVWLISTITFFLSAFLDNLTTAIVMTSLCSKILADKEHRLWFAGLIVIAANAGGAWSPLGDVTTTMLWIGGQITAINIITATIAPSLVVCLVPTYIIARRYKKLPFYKKDTEGTENTKEGSVILFTGIGLLLFVPLFKTITHMPPFMGMLLALGIIWAVTAVIHAGKEPEEKIRFSVSNALQKIDTPSILFFLGILLAVSALEVVGVLQSSALWLQTTLQNDYIIGVSLGVLSALVDNVPLVAAAQGMFSSSQFATDHAFWQFLALTTGTGGSMIIIGSAAGVAVMGIEHIQFGWYVRKIGWLAALGFALGVCVFILQQAVFG